MITMSESFSTPPRYASIRSLGTVEVTCLPTIPLRHYSVAAANIQCSTVRVRVVYPPLNRPQSYGLISLFLISLIRAFSRIRGLQSRPYVSLKNRQNPAFAHQANNRSHTNATATVLFYFRDTRDTSSAGTRVTDLYTTVG
jgi:hypothetical protein